jgi:putative transposase
MNETEPNPEDTVKWEEACRREDAIRKFVQHRTDGSNKPSIRNLSQDLGLSRATAYRMIELFRTGCTVTSLMAKSPGRPRGHRALDSKREDLIQETIETFYLKPTKPPVARLVLKELPMQTVTTVGLDIARSVFQLHVIDSARSVVVHRQLKGLPC